MKQSVLSFFLVLCLLLGTILCSCTASSPAPTGAGTQTTEEKDDPTTDEEAEPSDKKDLPPNGFLFAEDGALRFAYPSNWVKDTTSTSLSYEHPTNYSCVILETVDTADDEFHTMTAEQYEDRYAASFAEEVDGVLFKVSAERVTNVNGLDVATFSCFVTADGLTAKHLLYVVNIGDTSYRLILLLYETNEQLEKTILDSLKEITPATPSPEDPPKGYRFYTANDLRFLYPAAWDESTLTDPETGDEISINFGYAAAYFPEMDQALFDGMIRSSMTNSGFTVGDVTIEKTQNANGILINRIDYSITSQRYELSMHQYLFGFTLNRSAYAVLITLSETNDELAQKVFDSIENINPSTESVPLPGETASYEQFNLRISLPADWCIDDSDDQIFFYQGMNSVAVSSDVKSDVFDTITADEFKANYLPSLEWELGTRVYDFSLKRFTTNDSLTVTAVTYSFDLYGTTIRQTVYFVTVDQTTHTIVITAESAERLTELDGIVSSSIQATSGENYS